MFSSKVDLFKQDWIDTIFEGRNKEYGAYDLRRRESRMTSMALFIGVITASVLISIPVLKDKFGGTEHVAPPPPQEVTLVELFQMPIEEPPREMIIPPTAPIREMQTIKDIKKFTTPVVAPESEAYEDLVTQEELRKADAGSRNVDASEDGEVVINARPVEYAVEKQIVEDEFAVVGYTAVQVMPRFPGGEDKFREYIARALDGVTLSRSNRNVRMDFSFVVEKDGSLTDIKIVNDGGYPDIANRAVNVLKKSPRWEPGVNNGRPVRVAFAIPVVFAL